jgi:hypothetical protein
MWSGGTYTKSNAGTGGWTGDAVAGIAIDATRHDTQDNDFAAGINQCLTKDGQNSCTADLNFGGFRPSNVAGGSAAAPAYTANNDTDTGAFSPAANAYAIATGGVERVRVDSSGRVGIGALSPLTPLNVSGQANDTDGSGSSQGQVIIQDSDNAVSGLVLGYRYQVAVAEYARIQTILGTALAIQAGGGNVGIGLSNPAYRLQLSADSAAKPTTNTWTIASDARIKTNVQDYTKGLNEIKQVRPVTYDYNGLGGNAAGPGGISIIAQEIQSVFPECVGHFFAKLHPDDAEETPLLNYNGHAVTFALINAVKELAAKVELLEAKVAVLEGA